eukprot:2148711-Prymnesium_polylepis.1
MRLLVRRVQRVQDAFARSDAVRACLTPMSTTWAHGGVPPTYLPLGRLAAGRRPPYLPTPNAPMPPYPTPPAVPNPVRPRLLRRSPSRGGFP